jgi:hypothetical protein
VQRITVLLCGLLVVAGCSATGAETSPPAPPPPPAEQEQPAGRPAETEATTPVSACALLPEPEAEALAGTALEDGVESNPQSPQCLYAGPTTGPAAQVEVFVGDGAKKFLDIDRELAHEFTEVPGVGEEAHAEDNAIFARVGDTWFVVRLVRLNDPAQNAPALVTAATAVASRLQQGT